MAESDRVRSPKGRRSDRKSNRDSYRPTRSKMEAPRPISELSYEEAGPNLAKAYLVVIGSEGEEVIVDVPNVGQFKAYLNETLFCVKAGRRGRLMIDEGRHIFVPQACTQTELRNFLGTLTRSEA